MEIISYPKTGRTWLRMMIGRYFCARYSIDETRILETPYLTAQAGVRVTKFGHDGSNLRRMTPWRNLSDRNEGHRGKRILLLTRSVEDTMVSAWFQVSKRLAIYHGSLSEMLRDERFGVQRFIAFYDSWYRRKNVPLEFLEVSYEDMHQDSTGVLRRVLAFIGEESIDETVVRSSVEYCSFDNMRRIEQAKALNQRAMRPTNPDDVDSHKVRRGIVGGFTDYLSSGDIDYIRQLAIAADCPFIRSASDHRSVTRELRDQQHSASTPTSLSTAPNNVSNEA